MDAAEREAMTARWIEAMCEYVEFLYRKRFQNAKIAARLTLLELPNLFALLDHLQRTNDSAATIHSAVSFSTLLQDLGKPRLMERVAQVRDAVSETLSEDWNHLSFQTLYSTIDHHVAGRRFREALVSAEELLRRAREAGDDAYPYSDYDLAISCWLMSRVLQNIHRANQALLLLDEAQQRFEAVAKNRRSKGAEHMATSCLAEKGACLLCLSRLDDATSAYEESIRRAERLGDERQIAVGKGQLGTVRLEQRRYPEALAAHEEARQRFAKLGEPLSVAVSWHQIGKVCRDAGTPEAAEDAYRKSLAIRVRIGDVAGQAGTLLELGNLYAADLDHPVEAVNFYRNAAGKYAEIGDATMEAVVRGNLGDGFRKLRRYEEARKEILSALKCGENSGLTSFPWNIWAILADIETDAGNPAAAAEAKRKAITCYLAYRRDGGENHHPDGRICLAVTQSLLAGDPAQAASLLRQQLPRFEAAGFDGFIRALQAIVAGSRDRTLADAPELHYTMAAEILFLLETLEKPR